MPQGYDDPKAAGGDTARRLFVYNGGFLTQRRVRRILELSGNKVALGKPGEADLVGVWGQSPTAPRGEGVAARTGNPILRVEDAFLRSVKPGRDGEPPLGLVLDQTGVHFDGRTPSDLETLLATHPLDDTALLDRARACAAQQAAAHLSKYNAFDPATPVPEAPYVLVLDQTRGDASLTACGADVATFRDMLVTAQLEHPGLPVYVKTHPETAQGHRQGHFDARDASARVHLLSDPVSPWALMEGAVAVYTVSSLMGFEAIYAGHRPVVFGQPFYAGWGLTDDRMPVARRSRSLTRAQLYAGVMLLYPKWYDPFGDRLCDLEEVLTTLPALARAWREDRRGWVGTGIRLWKRKPFQLFFGTQASLRFQGAPDKALAQAQALDRPLMGWAGKVTPELESAAHAAQVPLARVEDGFLRSKGLGAELIPPLSLVLDDLGIYYDPRRESRLERLIAASEQLLPEGVARAEALQARILKAGLSKYNLTAPPLPPLPEGHRILVPGQVEDDASIRTGTQTVASNLALLEATRAANPEAVILYKPHPDVEAGLRQGAVAEADLARLADAVLREADPVALLKEVKEVWTMTSLLGFEALLRGVPVTCLGTPFYAGWGLTQDLGEVPARRKARPALSGLIHAALIDYPRYCDPITGLPCPPEVIVARLAAGDLPRPGPFNRSLSKLQGLFASRAYLWR
ncbi:capsular polysaccharide biosynthesis protein [Pseudoruegeria sp. SHC-113]|uniref:capsular polysaccharide biosynthesis protein n=1 Tax=Pseudoruegeria sp. SHC-113 TaxID=2855439 RepID=UPI0021BB7AC0|nr:capsular polysaccharide biosynthesis protein [Pseudoruegeria sp. SHC-113]MCT8159337.1 capsular polysaccharide biosynthesis protein [Pseudoruegeria sp. SHC-113]